MPYKKTYKNHSETHGFRWCFVFCGGLASFGPKMLTWSCSWFSLLGWRPGEKSPRAAQLVGLYVQYVGPWLSWFRTPRTGYHLWFFMNMYETYCYNQWGLESHLELGSPTNCGLTVGVSEKNPLNSQVAFEVDWLIGLYYSTPKVPRPYFLSP